MQLNTTCAVPCLVSSARPWLKQRRRDLNGLEALALQGFPLSRYCLGSLDNERFTQPHLLSMAGNAMSGFLLIPFFISIFTYALWDLEEDEPMTIQGPEGGNDDNVEAPPDSQTGECDDSDETGLFSSSIGELSD